MKFTRCPLQVVRTIARSWMPIAGNRAPANLVQHDCNRADCCIDSTQNAQAVGIRCRGLHQAEPDVFMGHWRSLAASKEIQQETTMEAVRAAIGLRPLFRCADSLLFHAGFEDAKGRIGTAVALPKSPIGVWPILRTQLFTVWRP